MKRPPLLMIPGPTNVSAKVLRSLARPPLSHVSSDFASILKETLTDLARIFKTSGLVLPLAGSGTLAAEVAMANIIEPGDRVLAVSGGYFGDRLAQIATTLGANVEKFEVPWGSIADPSEVERKLSAASYKALLAVHVDTSTGAANPVEKLAKVAKSNNALFLVDAVCSLGAMDIRMDDWGIDVCFTASQKALAAPPGLAIISFGPSALKARDERTARMQTFYGDLKRWAPVMRDPTKYFATHPVNMIYSLHESCRMILKEGLAERFARHTRLGRAFREAMQGLGLRLLCSEGASASTLTVVHYPDGVDDQRFRKAIAERYGIAIAGGLGPLAGRVFRVGHMGNVNRAQVLATVRAVESGLAEQGYKFKRGAGLAAAMGVFRSE